MQIEIAPMETCMQCQILFSVKNKRNIINLSSAEFACSVVKVKQIKHRNKHKNKEKDIVRNFYKENR